MAVYRITPPDNPLGRVLAAVVAVLVLAGAFMLGLVALAVVAALAFVVGMTAWLRSLFFRRRVAKAGEHSARPARSTETIEAEYTVLSRRREP